MNASGTATVRSTDSGEEQKPLFSMGFCILHDEAREIDGLTAISETDLTYTGQPDYAYIKLLDFGAGWYSTYHSFEETIAVFIV